MVNDRMVFNRRAIRLYEYACASARRITAIGGMVLVVLSVSFLAVFSAKANEINVRLIGSEIGANEGAPLANQVGERIASLKIQTGIYDGAWRYLPDGGINWYFMFSAMVLSEYFTEEEILGAVETALNHGVVGTWQPNARYAANTKVVIDGRIFFCNIEGVTGPTAPDVSGIEARATFVTDGTVVWEYLGLDVPKGWQWFLADIENDLFNIVEPDSTDAYAGLLLAAARKGGASREWLTFPSKFPSVSRIELLEALAKHNITDELEFGLTSTFQDDIAADGMRYDISFLADNVEAWRGMLALEALQELMGNLRQAAAAQNAAMDIKAGVIALWNAEDGRFATYRGQSDLLSIEGNPAFVSDLRFHIWPWLHGMWSTPAEIKSYALPVLEYTGERVPGLWSDSLDTFALGEWYYAAATLSDSFLANQVLRNRFSERSSSAVTITDAALTHNSILWQSRLTSSR